MLLWLSLALLEMFSAGAVLKRKLKWIFWQNMATVKFLILCVCCGLGVYSEISKTLYIWCTVILMQHSIWERELWFFCLNQMPGTAQCPFHDHDKEDQNDKNQDNAVTMILYDLEKVQDDDDDFILRLSHAPRPAHISGDPLSGQTTLILVIIFGCTLPTTCFLL